MNYLANDSSLQVENNLPQVTVEDLNKFNKSKLIIKDQWASHPSTEDRVERLDKLNLSAKEPDYSPASEIFKNIEETQKAFTEKLFSNVVYEESPQYLSLNDFKKDYEQQFNSNTFSKVYGGYYDDKNPIPFEMDNIESNANTFKFDELFSKKNIDLVYTSISMQNDIEVLKQISSKQIQVKTFDFNGKKYNRNQSNNLIKQLEKELEEINQQIKQNDVNIFVLFRNIEKESSANSLTNKYVNLFDYEKELHSKHEIYSRLSTELQFISYTTPFDQIAHNFIQIEPIEKELKKEIKEILQNELFQAEITKEIRTNFESYLSKDWNYFANESYNEENLQVLYNALNNFAFIVSRGFFLLKKDLLDYQNGLL